MMAALLAGMLASAPAPAGYYSPAEAKQLFEQGIEAYGREDFTGARTSFQQLVDHGFTGPDVLYNLGTSELAAGDLGQGVVSLERARQQAEERSDIDANLAVARSRQLDRVVGQMEEGLIQRIAHATREDWAGGLFLALWAAGFMLLIVLRVRPALGGPGLRALAFTLILTALLPLGLLGAHVYAREGPPEGVVVAKVLAARDAPVDRAKVTFEVHAALKVRVLEAAGPDLRIRLPNGLEGWVERSGIVSLER